MKYYQRRKVVVIVKYEVNNEIMHTVRLKVTIRKTIWFAIFICLIIELAFFFSYRFIEQSLVDEQMFEHIIQYIAKPTSINLLIAAIYHVFGAILKKESVKSFTMVAAISAICFNLTITHYTLPSLMTIFCLPIFITSMFERKKLTKIVLLLTFIFYASTIYFANYKSAIPLTFDGYYIDAFIAFAVILSSYIFTNVLINYHMEYVFITKSNSLRQTEIIEQVKRDPLTNLYNKKIFYDSLSVAMKQCNKLCVAVLDIDNFKTVNDTYGHSVGDIVLVALADMLTNISSKKILTARYGGEEFSIIFKDMTTFESYDIVETLRLEFSELTFPQMDNKSVTFSCGLSGDSPSTLSSIDFFNEADQALYYAKSNGKNQTVIFTSLDDE